MCGYEKYYCGGIIYIVCVSVCVLMATSIWFNIILEALASGLFAVVVYSILRMILIELGYKIVDVQLYYLLFVTGYYKHWLSYYLGLSDYLSTQLSKNISQRVVTKFYTSVGSKFDSSTWVQFLVGVFNYFHKLDTWVVVLLESGLEAIHFVVFGMILYWATGLRDFWNVFVTGIVLYMVIDFVGWHLPINRLMWF